MFVWDAAISYKLHFLFLIIEPVISLSTSGKERKKIIIFNTSCLSVEKEGTH
jgi:hypothetical protein